MAIGVTTIGNEQSDLRIHVYAEGDGHGNFLGAVIVNQGIWKSLDDCVAVIGSGAVKALIEAIEMAERAAVWGSENGFPVVIGEDDDTKIYVSMREGSGEFKTGILIEQASNARNLHVGGTILVDSPDRARMLANAIHKRWDEQGFGWS